MKKSNQFIVLAIILLLIPGLLQKINLNSKFKSNKWVFHSSRIKQPMNTIDQIRIKDIKTFHYQFDADSSYLEFHKNVANIDYSINSDHILILSALQNSPSDEVPKNAIFRNTSGIFDQLFGITGIFSFLIPNLNQSIFGKSFFENYTVNNDFIVFKGPKCPKIIAENAVIYIDSIGTEASFDLDLDFSACYWQNYNKSNLKIDKSLTQPWNIKKLNLKVNNANYYLNEGLFFDTLIINAFNRADLIFDSDNYRDADITVDPTVLISAPFSIWEKLNIVRR